MRDAFGSAGLRPASRGPQRGSVPDTAGLDRRSPDRHRRAQRGERNSHCRGDVCRQASSRVIRDFTGGHWGWLLRSGLLACAPPAAQSATERLLAPCPSTTESIRLPFLELAADGKRRHVRDVPGHPRRSIQFGERSGRNVFRVGGRTKFHNRVLWAAWELKAACLLESPRRGYIGITERGSSRLSEEPTQIDRNFLERFPEFRARFKKPVPARRAAKTGTWISGPSVTPEEAIESAYRERRDNLAADLQSVLEASPDFFEELVVDLLVGMGYRRFPQGGGEAIGRSGDEGIDGRIKEDPLGLDVVYIQAKRWKQPVGRPEVQRFAGALQGQRARKGVLITTSSFTPDATEYVRNIEAKIVLMDGSELVDFMIDHDVGSRLRRHTS